MLEFWRAWSITVLVETLVLNIAVGAGKRVILTGIFASSLTLPWLWFVGANYIRNYNLLVLFGEPIIFIIEAVFIHLSLGVNWQRASILSLTCNAASFCVGLVIP